MVIDKIYHIADVHIRNLKRHREYKIVFDRLFEYIKSTKTENSIIYLAGDIVHSKNEMSPELIRLVSYFLKGCTQLLPTVLIIGNHDTNLNNETRLDALTPIVDNLNLSNLYYWKDNGVYELGGVHFSVFSIFANPDEWIKASDIIGNYKIALHHGAVNSAITDLKHVINNEYVNTNVFNGFDLTLLGDIHKRQFLDENNTIAYPGSLIQQNHAELLDHGILVWDLKTKKSEYVPIKNDIGYVTVDIDNGKIVTPKEVITNYPEKIRLRLRYTNTQQKDLNKIIDIFKKKYSIIEISLQKSHGNEISQYHNTTNIGDVRDIEFQNNLITEYLTKIDVNKTIDIDKIRHINRVMNSKLILDDVVIRNVIWRPLKFSFSNMFSYGEGNVYDFNKRGVQGIYGSNAIGKSSLLDAITFCLYDKCTRTFRSSDIINNKKNTFKCKLNFILDEVEYIIERIGERNKRVPENVKVNVNFWKVGEDGELISLNGQDRDQTNKVIRSYIGTYDDFLLTALSSQNDSKNFVFKSQRERKDLLNSFLGISIFDSLYNLTRNEIKGKREYLKMLEIDLGSTNHNDLLSSIENTNSKFQQYSSSFNDYEDTATKYNDKILELTNKINPNIQLIDSHKLNIDIDTNNSNLVTKEQELATQIELLQRYVSEQNVFEVLLSSYDKSNLLLSKNKLDERTSKFVELDGKRLVLESKIESLQTEITKLENHKFNPDCEFCIQNEFVKSAQRASIQLPITIKEHFTLKNDINSISVEITSLKEDEAKLNELLQLETNIITNRHNIVITENKIDSLKKDLKRLESKHIELNNLLNKFELQKKEIELNNRYTTEISELNQSYVKIKEKVKTTHASMIDLNSSLITLQNQYSAFKEKQAKLTEVWREIESYDYYLQAISKDGVPYLLLEKILPVIEIEVNTILNQLVDFTVTLSTDDKNNINCYLLYGTSDKWPVELSSGMERFVVSIATRVALINITSLPRPNFLAIDEGFGVMDSDNVNSLNQLFDYLKNQFDFIMVITHIDSMKDLSDETTYIVKTDDGFSKLGHDDDSIT